LFFEETEGAGLDAGLAFGRAAVGLGVATGVGVLIGRSSLGPPPAFRLATVEVFVGGDGLGDFVAFAPVSLEL
jgi:hypothetical protein